MEKIKECPFCGNNRIYYQDGVIPYVYHLRCLECKIDMIVYADSKEDAINIFNRRASK